MSKPVTIAGRFAISIPFFAGPHEPNVTMKEALDHGPSSPASTDDSDTSEDSESDG